MMKRFAILLAALCMGLGLAAQTRPANVSTRRYKFSDFSDKVTKVVMSGNDMLDSALRQEVLDRWSGSPFEFCTLDEYRQLKTSTQYYFLLAAEGQGKDDHETGILFLTLLKGGSETQEGSNAQTEVISLPLAPASGGSGRELVFLPALVEGIQDFILKAMESEKSAYSGLGFFNQGFSRKGHTKRICFSEDDLSPSLSSKDRERFMDEDMFIREEDEADNLFMAGTYNTLVSYMVAPTEATSGDLCYKMLIDAGTRKIQYLKKHKISARNGAGFLRDDLRRIARSR